MTGNIRTVSEDFKLFLVELKEPAAKFQLDDSVEMYKTRTTRSAKLNSLYFSFLAYCIEKGLRNHGHYSITAVHENVKSWMTNTHKLEYKKEFTTADMSFIEFKNYFDIVEREMMNQYFGIDTSQFFQDYEEFKAWEAMNPDGTFREFFGVRGKA